MSVGMKREYFLFLKGIFPPSRMTSDEGPYVISGKTFFSKSRLLMGAAVKNRGCVYHCSKVHAGASACSLLCFPPSPHCKLSRAPTSGGVPGHCCDEVEAIRSDRNPQNLCLRAGDPPGLGQEGKKGVISCPHPGCCAKTKEPQGQQTPPAACC